MRKILLPVLVAAGLFLGAMPAQAGNLAWTDPAGDASMQKGVVPNDDAVDLLSTRLQTNAKSLEWSAKVAKAVEGHPTGSLGYFFIFEFTYGDSTYDLRVLENVAFKEMTLRKVGTTEVLDRPCKDCKYKFDRKSGTVSIEAPLASLAESIKAADAAAPPFGKGSTISKLIVNSYKNYGRSSLRWDDAPAPEGTTYTV